MILNGLELYGVEYGIYLDTLIELFGIPLIIVMAISSRRGLHCLESAVV